MIIDVIINEVIPLLGELGIFAIIVTVLGWVAKDAISQYFDKELNEYQAKIDKELKEHQASIDKELNEYRNELEKDRLRYTKLHNKRAEITAELYEKFVEFEEDLRSLTHPMQKVGDPAKDEKLENTAKSGNEFLNFYMMNKIYFPPEVCETVEEIVEESMEIHKEKRTRAAKFAHREMEPGDFEKELDYWERVTEEDIPKLKEELENHFRELLGVELGE